MPTAAAPIVDRAAVGRTHQGIDAGLLDANQSRAVVLGVADVSNSTIQSARIGKNLVKLRDNSNAKPPDSRGTNSLGMSSSAKSHAAHIIEAFQQIVLRMGRIRPESVPLRRVKTILDNPQFARRPNPTADGLQGHVRRA